jgi:hypothetical protein
MRSVTRALTICITAVRADCPKRRNVSTQLAIIGLVVTRYRVVIMPMIVKTGMGSTGEVSMVAHQAAGSSTIAKLAAADPCEEPCLGLAVCWAVV